MIFKTTKFKVSHLYAKYHVELYFPRSVDLNLSFADPGQIQMPNNTFYVETIHPDFYEMMECLVDAYLNDKIISVDRSISRIVFIEELGIIPEDKKRKNAIDNCLFIFKNDVEMVNHTWEKYEGYTSEEKTKFWRRCLSKRKHVLRTYNYDPYYIFSPEVYEFWKGKEPDIDVYLKEAVSLLKFDREIVERNLGKKLW